MFNLKYTKLNFPFDWINLTDLFNEKDAKDLAETYPKDHYRTITSNSNARQYNYDVRALVSFEGKLQNENCLSDSWYRFAKFINSQGYRKLINEITRIDVSELPVEANVYKYAKNCFMDAHQDLNTKILTQVVYFNDKWNVEDGGCLNILKSKNTNDLHERILPLIGNSIIIIRSDNSWHSVEPTVCDKSRRSVTITFYKKGNHSPMWGQQSYLLHENHD